MANEMCYFIEDIFQQLKKNLPWEVLPAGEQRYLLLRLYDNSGGLSTGLVLLTAVNSRYLLMATKKGATTPHGKQPQIAHVIGS